MEGLDTGPSPDGVAADAAADLSRMFAMSPDLLAAAGFDGLLKRFNGSWTRRLGYSEEVLRTTPYLEFVHPDDLEATRAEIARLAAGEYVVEYECRIFHADGSVRRY